jgi:hypothetical protein
MLRTKQGKPKEITIANPPPQTLMITKNKLLLDSYHPFMISYSGIAYTILAKRENAPKIQARPQS